MFIQSMNICLQEVFKHKIEVLSRRILKRSKVKMARWRLVVSCLLRAVLFHRPVLEKGINKDILIFSGSQKLRFVASVSRVIICMDIYHYSLRFEGEIILLLNDLASP